MKRVVSGLCAAAIAAQAPALAASDRVQCERLLGSGRPGLYLAAGDELAPVGGAARYTASGRLFYLVADSGGRAFRVSRATVWHVRTQTTGNAGEADEAFVSRDAVTTECSGGKPLPSFGPSGRFVSLPRYLDHHAASAAAQKYDAPLGADFHFVVSDPTQRVACAGRTDDPRTLGRDLRQVYGFEGVTRSDGLLARSTQTSRALASAAPVYSGLSSELAYVAAGEPACFGFTMPMPTRSSLIGQILPFLRGGPADWQPQRTEIDIQTIPQGARLRSIALSWSN